MTRRKKLIEVALPLVAINEESSRRKRKAPGGYPTTLHKWWAQRPIAACRAVLFASLVDDPSSDPAYRKADGSVDEERAGEKRAELFTLIEELVKWENSTNPRVINAARAEIARCVASRKIETGELVKDKSITLHLPEPEWTGKPFRELTAKPWDFVIRRAKPEQVDAFLLEHAPPALDPFAGGGSIPLEIQRLGLRAYGSDLNPVPVLITKALIELPAYFSGMPAVNPDARSATRGLGRWDGTQGLVADILHYGEVVRDEVLEAVSEFFPSLEITASLAEQRPDLKPYVGQSLPVVAWLWARTVPSPDPSTGGAAVPLLRTFVLCSKAQRKAFVVPQIKTESQSICFEVRVGTPPKGFDPSKGTVSQKRLKGGRCLLTDAAMGFPYIREQAKAGKMGLRLLAMAVDAGRGRVYVSPTADQEAIALSAKAKWRPDAEFPKKHRNFQPPVYGFDNLGDIFTDRQALVLNSLAESISALHGRIRDDAAAAECPVPDEYATAVCTYLAFALTRAADYNSMLSSWRPKDNAMRSTLAKQALPMVWDFAEGNPFAKSSAGFIDCVKVVAKCLEHVPAEGFGSTKQLNATAAVNGVDRAVICTDPPYYDNIGYADLADYLYVWLRRALHNRYPELFRTLLTPKAEELIASPHRCDGDHEKAQQFFETGLGQAFARARERQAVEYPLTVFYAFKQSEEDEDEDDDSDSPGQVASTGWETMLEGLLAAGFTITGTWPMRTEGDNRQIGNEANALASSIVLVCYPRNDAAPMASRREFVSALRGELPNALRDLQSTNIAPVDLAQAAIGPGMAVFSRYSKVIESSGERMGVRAALALINQVLDEVLAEQEGDFDADSRWALAWFEQFGFAEGEYGVAETLSKAKNTSVEGLKDAGILTSARGKVRILKPEELPASWDPLTDTRLTTWEMVHHLIRAFESGGESSAAELVAKLGGNAETARELCYRLYTLCERKKRPSEAMSYNALVQSWPEIVRLAREGKKATASDSGLFTETEG